jgi:leader peptidase (prepilin peptidase) / N-methyltransferase
LVLSATMRLEELHYFIPFWVLRPAALVFGLLWGSFLNVVIYRVPREMSVVRPPSHCPGCGEPIRAYDNVPVFSYVILRGRARCCGVRMSPRYPLVELIGGALSLAVLEVVIFDLPGSVSVGRAAAIYGADFSLCMALVAAAFIDAEHMFLPDSITIGGAIVGVVTATLRGLSTLDSVIGLAVGFFGIYVPFIFLYKGLLGRTGMGLGDAKLLGLAGAWFGWPGALFTLLAGAVHGSAYAGVTRLLGIEPKLPDAVLEDIAQLEKDAAEGDEEAQKALAEDPLTEDEDNPFIIRFVQRIFGLSTGSKQVAAPGGETIADTTTLSDGPGPEALPARARIPFGPFLILAIFELLFAEDWLKSHLLRSLWP